MAESRWRNSKSTLLKQEQVLQDMWQHCRARLHKREGFTFPFSAAALCLLHFSALASPFNKRVTEGLPWESEHWKTIQLQCCYCFCSHIKTRIFWRKQGIVQGRALQYAAFGWSWEEKHSALEVLKGVRVTVPLTGWTKKAAVFRKEGMEKEEKLWRKLLPGIAVYSSGLVIV